MSCLFLHVGYVGGAFLIIILMIVASVVIVMSKTKHKEQLNKMSWIQISAVAILCIVATGLAVGIIYGTINL